MTGAWTGSVATGRVWVLWLVIPGPAVGNRIGMLGDTTGWDLMSRFTSSESLGFLLECHWVVTGLLVSQL